MLFHEIYSYLLLATVLVELGVYFHKRWKFHSGGARSISRDHIKISPHLKRRLDEIAKLDEAPDTTVKISIAEKIRNETIHPTIASDRPQDSSMTLMVPNGIDFESKT